MKNPISPLLRNMQRGFTLIELMVSMAIGLVIVVFVSALYVSSVGSYRINDDNMRIQQDGRAALHLIGQNLMQAQFGNLITLEANHAFTDFPGINGKEGQGLHGCDAGFAAPNIFAAGIPAACGNAGAPAFEISYRAEDVFNADTGSGADCNGVAPVAAAGGIVVNRFYLAPDANGVQALYCRGNGGGAPQLVLGNVAAMQLTYGVDNTGAATIDGEGDKSPDRFMTVANGVNGVDRVDVDAVNFAVNAAADPTIPGAAAAVGYPESWKRVVSVGVCLEIASANNVTPSFQTYTNCAGNQVTANDRNLHTVLTKTFTLRNNAAASTL